MEPSPAQRERAFRLKPSSLKLTGDRQLLMTCIIAFMLLISVGLDGPQMGRLREPPVGLYAVEAIQIVIVKKGDAAPGDTAGAYVPYVFNCSLSQVGETTKSNPEYSAGRGYKTTRYCRFGKGVWLHVVWREGHLFRLATRLHSEIWALAPVKLILAIMVRLTLRCSI